MATIAYTNNGDGTATLAMSWTAAKAKLDLLGADAGKYFYNARWMLYDENGEPIPWDELTNQQKLNVLLQESQRHLREGAYALYVDETVNAAKAGVETEEDRYDMED